MWEYVDSQFLRTENKYCLKVKAPIRNIGAFTFGVAKANTDIERDIFLHL